MRGLCSVSTNSPPAKSRPGSLRRIATCSGKTRLAVDVLMQAIVVAGPIAQDERRRPGLPGGAAAFEEFFVRRGIVRVEAHRRAPPVGDRRQPGIEMAAQFDDQLRQRVGEISVFAPPETVARHHDRRPEALLFRVHRRQRVGRFLAAGGRARRRSRKLSSSRLERRPVEPADRRLDPRTLIRPNARPLPLA